MKDSQTNKRLPTKEAEKEGKLRTFMTFEDSSGLTADNQACVRILDGRCLGFPLLLYERSLCADPVKLLAETGRELCLRYQIGDEL
jgi:hypothetical protein